MLYIHVAHIAALLSSCVSFGLIIWSGRWDGQVGVLCVFSWTFSFTGSLLILLMEMIVFHQYASPVSWRNIPLTISSFATLFCLNVSIIFPHYFLQGQEDNEFYSHCMVAEIFSCIAALGHLVEVWIMWVQSNCYMASGPGLLQVAQTYVASAILFFLANSVSFKDHPLVILSLAVYCLCFICTFASIICCAVQDKHNPIWFKGFNLIAAAMYLSAPWPVPHLRQNLGQIVHPESCQDDLGLWPETRLIVVVALTALNFLLYLLSVCCCCMLRLNSDDAEAYSTRTSTSDVCPTQMSNDTREVLPVASSGALRLYNTTNNIQSMSWNNLRSQQNHIIICKRDVQINISNK